MKIETIIEIYKECPYCKNPPTHLIKIKVRRFSNSFDWEEFTCKEHIDNSYAKAFKSYG